jgi:hypothetical protein
VCVYRGQLIDVGAYSGQLIDVGVYRGQLIDVSVYIGQLIDVDVYRGQLIDVGVYRGLLTVMITVPKPRVTGNNVPWNKCPGTTNYVVMILIYGHWFQWPCTLIRLRTIR